MPSLTAAGNDMSIKHALWVIGLALTAHAWDVAAQCPAGIPSAGNPQCVPPNAPGWRHGAPASSQESVVPRPRWKRTWGAIAADGVSAALGVASGEDSKGQAEKVALKRCREQGGKQCVLDVSYYDQCAVLVTGKSRYLTQTAISIERASELGIEKCSARDTECRVYYSNCSLPVRVD